MSKQHIFLTFFILLTLVSCGLDAKYADGYIHTESVQRAICKSISGDVKSKLLIFYADTSSHWKPLKEGTGYTRDVKKDSIVNYSYSIGDYGNQYIVFPDFPISLLGHVVSDTTLAHALALVEPKAIVMKYQIGGAARLMTTRAVSLSKLSPSSSHCSMVARAISWVYILTIILTLT